MQEMCDHAKAELKAMPTQNLGSWQNAVTMADVCWLTKGHAVAKFSHLLSSTT